MQACFFNFQQKSTITTMHLGSVSIAFIEGISGGLRVNDAVPWHQLPLCSVAYVTRVKAWSLLYYQVVLCEPYKNQKSICLQESEKRNAFNSLTRK